jgi:FkbM family methyltransferase
LRSIESFKNILKLFNNTGQFTLFAAKMGHKVLSVEPFHDNILRIHKASKMENTYGRITLIKNAISNKRNEIKKLDVVNDNIGAQSLFFNRNKSFEKDPNNKYLVETILLDDIVPYLPSTQSKQALLKIDIQFYEIFAFEHATNLFDTVDIRFVFMEWDIGLTLNEYENKLIALIDFFYNRNYEPFSDHDTLLAREDWKKWTSNILWKKS